MKIHKKIEFLNKCQIDIENVFNHLDQQTLSKIWYATNQELITHENSIIRGAILNIYEKKNYKEVLD